MLYRMSAVLLHRNQQIPHRLQPFLGRVFLGGDPSKGVQYRVPVCWCSQIGETDAAIWASRSNNPIC